MMFEYNADLTMSLNFNEHKNEIVFNHLSASQEGLLNGQYQFYGPDGSYDALEFHRDKWFLREDVDVRNEKNKNDRAAKPDPKKQTPMYKPKRK